MGISFKKIGDVLKGFGHTVHEEGEDIEKAAKNGAKGGVGKAISSTATEIKDSFVDIGGAAIGYAEMLGLKYSVKPYQFKVSDQLSRGSRLEGAAYDKLKADGFKGIVNLCAENDMDAAAAAQLGMTALHIPIIDNTAPTVSISDNAGSTGYVKSGTVTITAVFTEALPATSVAVIETAAVTPVLPAGTAQA